MNIKVIGLIAGLCMAGVSPAAIQAQQTAVEVTDSLNNILSQARQGDAEMQNEVGKWYYIGRHVKQDYGTALQWFVKSAKQDNAKAIGNMARCYQLGHGVDADSVMASKLYLKAFEKGNTELLEKFIAKAENGDLFSALTLIEACERGIPPLDKGQTIKYKEIAANLGYRPAMLDLGLHYMNAKQAIKAAPWFKKGADAGDVKCAYWYGYQLLNGKGLAPDPAQGANYMLKCAEAGMPKAMVTVGDCYMSGKGLTRNPEQAVRWYKLAAGAGDRDGQWNLAQCHREGNGTPVSYEQAVTWYAYAYRQGMNKRYKDMITDSIADSPFVKYLDGMKAYYAGDYNGAMTAFKAVDKSGIADGRVMTAAVLLNKDYKKADGKKGVKMLKEAAKSNPQAMYMLAKLYERGEYVERDMTAAVDYVTRSAEAGYGKAMCMLADMYYEGRGVPQSYESAVKWYAEADRFGMLSTEAAKRYATCYENGWGGLEQSKATAAEILKVKRGPFVEALLGRS